MDEFLQMNGLRLERFESGALTAGIFPSCCGDASGDCYETENSGSMLSGEASTPTVHPRQFPS